jgi:hypothetical protein
MIDTLITIAKITLLIASVGLFAFGVWTEQRAARRFTHESRQRSRRRRPFDLPPSPDYRRVWLGLDMLAITYVVWIVDWGRMAGITLARDWFDFYVTYLTVPGVIWGEIRAHKSFGAGPLVQVYQHEGAGVLHRFAGYRWFEGRIEDASREPFRPPTNLLVFAIGVPVFTALALLPFALILLISPILVVRAMWVFWFRT